MKSSYHITVFCLILTLLIISGCARKEPADSVWRRDNGKVKVLTTIAMINDIVRQVGDDRVDTIPLIRGELDPHSYELVKGDDEKFSRADLIFHNGLGLEHGLSLKQNLENNPKSISVGDPILKNNPNLILTVDGQYDPHIWMDIALWIHTVDPIVQALAEQDPKHAEEYRARGAALVEKMQQEDKKIFNLLQAIPEDKRYLVTSHNAFNYFTRHYLAQPGEANWQIRCQAPEGLAPEAHMSVNDIIVLIDHIQKYKIGVLFPESNVSRDSLRKILDGSQQKGRPIRISQEVLYGDSMGEAPNYLEMILHNGEVIAQELNYE